MMKLAPEPGAPQAAFPELRTWMSNAGRLADWGVLGNRPFTSTISSLQGGSFRGASLGLAEGALIGPIAAGLAASETALDAAAQMKAKLFMAIPPRWLPSEPRTREGSLTSSWPTGAETRNAMA